MENATPYTPKNKVRIVTAASLFDGHDAAINIMRRIMQRTGCEVIHLGHDRSVAEVSRQHCCAVTERAALRYALDDLADHLGPQRFAAHSGISGVIR